MLFTDFPAMSQLRVLVYLAAASLLLALLTGPNAAHAAIPAVNAEGEITAEQVDAAVASIEAREDLDDETRSLILDRLREAQALLQSRAAARRDTQAYGALMESAPERIEELTAELNEPAPPPPSPGDLGVTRDIGLRELEQILSREGATLDSNDATLAQIEADIQSIENRPPEARERIDVLRSEITELERKRDEAPAPNELNDLTDARRLANELRISRNRAELQRLDEELSSLNLRAELLRVQRDLATRNQAIQRLRVDLLTTVVNEERRTSAEEAQSAALEVEQEFVDSHPAVREIAAGNAELTRELPTIAEDIADSSDQLALINEQADSIERSLSRSEQRLNIAGVSQAIGRLLLEERRSLPQVSQYRADVRDRRNTLAGIGLAQVRIDEDRRELTPIAASVTDTMRTVALDIDDPAEIEKVREQVRELLINRRDLLQQASQSYASYLAALSDLDVAQRRLLDAAAKYQGFLDRHLLWIPSSDALSLNTFRNAGPALAWALSPTGWGNAWVALVEYARDRLLPTFILLLTIGTLFAVRPRLVKIQKELNGKVGRLSTDSIWLTLQAILIVAVRMLPLPLALASGGWALLHLPDASGLNQSIANALFSVAPFLYNTTLFRGLCAENGVAEVHFGWRRPTLGILRRQFDLLTAFGAPLAFVTVLFLSSPETAYRDSLGLLSFVALMVVLMLVLHPIEHPRNGIAASFYQREPGRWISRLRWVWYVLSVGAPAVLAFLALAGFIYTAATLTGSVVDTIWLILSLGVVNLSVLRWLALERRKIAWQAALDKREARKAGEEPAQHTTAETTAEGDAPVIEAAPLDLDEVDLQMRRLLRALLIVVGVVATYAIWGEVLPALNVFNEVTLWASPRVVDGAEVLEPVSLADALLAIVILIATFIASKNLPGLTQIVILQHLDLQPGSRYTINTLLRYFVITIGVIAVLNIVGLPWSRVQWLVAALSVGLGFGLQEIVANFVSGLIILFERPVRVGDTVTVGNLSGTVSRVRIRATTITDWDRKEIVVPNKEFITAQVVNWTLSDPITRIVIEVGVSYGTDVKLAHRVMEETLRANPLILDEPEPRAYFMGFGNSSLDFKLYMYSRQLGDRFPIMHSVHEDILHALREHDIEIPFPQRDLHLRSTVDVPVKND